jgi:cyanophycinase
MLVMACGAGGTAAPDAALPSADAALDAAPPPAPPADLQRWLIGDPADRLARPRPGLILMGGGADVDAAFAWQRDRIDGGDVVVLRASGADGYNGYLHDEIGGVDSVETLLVDTRALAAAPYVRWVLDHAEAIFLAGGDQAVYLDAWAASPVADALDDAWARGAVVGGTSAGSAVLGEIVFSASNGSVYSDEALADPYGPYMTLTRHFVDLSPLAGVVTDTHFAARDRMGRLLAFVARAMTDGWAETPLGVGIDEGTALVVDEDGMGTVRGAGAVYVLAPDHPPAACAPGEPLAWSDVALYELRDGNTIALPSGATTVVPRALAAADGLLEPAVPY